MNRPGHRNHHGRRCHHVIHHHLVCEHEIEIEVWPENAEVYFKNESYVDPVNTRIQFESAIFNAPTNRVKWEVFSPDGGPGAGTINSSGLYSAPDYGDYQTDIVIATSIDDPTRKATAIVNIVGKGPEPVPKAVIEVFPKVVCLYCQTGDKISYIDKSNQVQQFRTIISNHDSSDVEWKITPSTKGNISNDGFYKAPNSIGTTSEVVKVTATLAGTLVKDEVRVVLLKNYKWPA